MKVENAAILEIMEHRGGQACSPRQALHRRSPCLILPILPIIPTSSGHGRQGIILKTQPKTAFLPNKPKSSVSKMFINNLQSIPWKQFQPLGLNLNPLESILSYFELV
jgi:hypothetical protein